MSRNYNDPKDKAFRQAVRRRDRHICQWPNCGKKGVQVHHILPYASSPALRYSVSNGICLCKALHHKMVTGNELAYASLLSNIVRKKNG